MRDSVLIRRRESTMTSFRCAREPGLTRTAGENETEGDARESETCSYFVAEVLMACNVQVRGSWDNCTCSHTLTKDKD
jgi:hypothetical protein